MRQIKLTHADLKHLEEQGIDPAEPAAKKPKKRSRAKEAESAARAARVAYLVARGLPKPETELRFHPERKWKFDFAWPAKKVALEVNGGAFIRGRHSRGQSQVDDWEKLNAAQVLGWKVLQCTPQQMDSGEIVATLLEAFKNAE